MAGSPLLLAGLVACLACVTSGLKVVQLEVGDGQGFADAIAAFGTSGEDTTIKLPYGRVFSVANATIVSAQGPRPFSSGVLTIEPADGDGTALTVFDAGMRFGMIAVNGTPTFLTGARLRLTNLVMINLCDIKVPFDTQNAFRYSNTAVTFGVFRRNRASQLHSYTNLTAYLRHADLTNVMYYHMMLRVAPEFKFAELVKSVAVEQARSDTWVRLTTGHSISITGNLASSVGVNTTYRSTADPYDPLMASLRAEGRLMEPRYCDGSVPAAPLVFDTLSPLWATTDTMSWLGAVSDATKRTAEPNIPFVPMPGVVMLVGKALPDQALPSIRVAPLVGPLLLSGPFNDEPGVVTESTLDLTGSERPLIQVASSGLLLMQLMTLKGLVARPLPQLANSAGGSDAARPRSAFPLSAFPLANSSSAIWMYNVTLVLPTADYLALLALALQGSTASISRCANASTQAHAAALQAGISALSLEQAEPDYTSFVLSSFYGWAINATGLVLQPTDPYSVWRTCQPIAAMAEQGSSNSSLTTQQIAIIAGCTVAGLVVLLAIVVGLVLLVRRIRPMPSPSTDEPTGIKSDSRAAGGPKMAPAAQQQPFLGLETAELPAADESGGIIVSFRPPSSGEEGRLRQCLLLQVVSAAEVKAGFKRGGRAPAAATVANQEDGTMIRTEGGGHDKPGAAADRGLAVVLLSKEVPHLATEAAEAGAVLSKNPDSPGRELRSHRSTSSDARDPRAAVTQLVNEMAGEKDTVVIQEVLGTGSWGTVYRGKWRGLDVALKTLVFEVEEGSGQKPRAGVAPQQAAITEAAVAASVDHRNVVRTYHYDIKAVHSKEQPGAGAGGLQIDMLENEGGYKEFKLFLVQELCSVSLSDAMIGGVIHDLKTGRMLESSVVLMLLLDIAEGLAYLHGRNIIHGDLKPANVLLKTAEDRPGTVVAKLADFGLSARMTGSATHVSNHRSGTPFYVAPEVVHEYRTSTASDVYSFGVLMWQLYSGLLPYQCSSKGEYSWNPVFPKFKRPNVPPQEFMSLTQKCLLRDPRQRPTAAQLITKLQELQQDREPRPPSS